MGKYNYKYLIGFILGILLCGSSVYAAIKYSSNVVSYDNTSSSLTSNNVQAAIDEIAARRAALTACPSGKLCIAFKNTLALGDYVSYTPSSTSYTTDMTKTGYTSTQTIDPSELKLWRVLRFNQNGTVDIISDNISSQIIYFQGRTGYQNFVGYLNVLASQYENSAYTVSSRHFGYDNQTEYITDTTYFTAPAPWRCATYMSCTPNPKNYEAYGGGDLGFTTDYNLVESVLGTWTAKKVDTGLSTYYWMASRAYVYSTDTYYWFEGRAAGIDQCTSTGSDTCDYFYKELHYYSGSNPYDNYGGYPIRPIVTLKSGLSYYGIGTRDYPMEIQQQ